MFKKMLIGLIGLIIVLFFWLIVRPGTNNLARYVRPETKWSHNELNIFLENMNKDQILLIKNALKIENTKNNTIESQDVEDIQKELFSSSNSLWGKIAGDHKEINYHEVVKWTANKLKINNDIIENYPTIHLEHAIFFKLFTANFIKNWDKMTLEQRQKFLQSILKDKGIDDNKIREMTRMAGGKILSTFIIQQILPRGFALYTTCSTIIYTLSTAIGVTFPFSVYTRAAEVLSFLTGPTGWVLSGIAVIVGGAIIYFGKDLGKTVSAILQIHALKIDSLHQTGKIPDFSDIDNKILSDIS